MRQFKKITRTIVEELVFTLKLGVLFILMLAILIYVLPTAHYQTINRNLALEVEK